MRGLRKHWKLTAVAIVSLAIAMAVGVLALSVSNTALLLAPSAKNPGELEMIYGRSPGKPFGEISYPDYQYFRENNHVFTDLAAAPETISVNGSWDGKQWVKVTIRPVSENYFSVMGFHAHLGNLFSPGDDSAKMPAAVMTYACWQRLGSDPKIIGTNLMGFTIVGVAERDFTGSLWGPNGDLFVSIWKADKDASWLVKRDVHNLALLGRMKPGVSPEQVRAEMAALGGQLSSAYPQDDRDRRPVVARATLLPPEAVPTAELVIGILMALVLMVLLIACANVANLLLAVAVGRRQEAAIKLALGAQRGRLVLDFLRESALICAASAALGYGIASFGIARLSHFTLDLPQIGEFTFGFDLKLDATVAAFTLGLMLIAILATGLAPALYASAPNLAQILGGEVVVGGTGKNVRRNALLMLQVAMCTFVLVGMGLGLRDLYNLRHVDPGFSARNLVATSAYATAEGISNGKAKELYTNLRRAVAALPGVESVALAVDLPLSFGFNDVRVQASGSDAKLNAAKTIVDANYFATFGIAIQQGRGFNSGDREGSPEVAVINRQLAEAVWPGRDPIGKTLLVDDPPQKVMVVGVAANGKYGELDEAQKSCVYLDLDQRFSPGVNVIARTAGSADLWIAPLEKTVREEGLTALFQPVTFDKWLNVTLILERVATGCVAVLSGLGLALAVMGLFGSISYSVSERKKELGIRVALGARPGQLLKMVVRETLIIAGSGVALGLLAGIAGTALVRSYLFGIGPLEWIVLGPVALGMLGVAMLVACISARPWIDLNPMEAVRHA